MFQITDNKNKLLLNVTIAVATWFAVYFSVLQDMVSVWQGSETYKHCFLILPICLYLLYEKRHELAQIEYHPNYIAAVPLLAVQAILLFSELTFINLIGHVSAYLSFVLVLWLVLGNQFVKTAIFPLFYLGFAVPVGEELVPVLQQITADLSIIFINLFQIPIYRDGLYLHIPNGVFVVAEACAGIRFLIATVAVGVLYTYMFFNGWRKRTVFIILSLLVPIVANGFRAAGIVIIGYYSDMEHAVGADHLVYGWVFFAIVLGLLILIGSFFQDPPLKHEVKEGKANFFSSPVVAVLTVAFLISGPAALSLLTGKTKSTVEHRLLNHSSKDFIVLDSAPWGAKFEDADHAKTYQSINRGYFIYTAAYDFETSEKELISWKNRQFDVDAFSIQERYPIHFEVNGIKGTAEVLQLASANGQDRTLVYFYQVNASQHYDKLKTKLAQLQSKLSGSRGAGSVVQLFFKSKINDQQILMALSQLEAFSRG